MQQYRIHIDPPNIAVRPKIDANAWCDVVCTMFPGNMDHVMTRSPKTWRCTDETGKHCLFLYVTWRTLNQSWLYNSDGDTRNIISNMMRHFTEQHTGQQAAASELWSAQHHQLSWTYRHHCKHLPAYGLQQQPHPDDVDCCSVPDVRSRNTIHRHPIIYTVSGKKATFFSTITLVSLGGFL